MRFSIAVCAGRRPRLGTGGLLLCRSTPPKKALEAAAAVCLPEVVKIEEAGQERTVTLKVEKWWKGGGKAELVVSTAKSGAACGSGFEKGKKYVVYAGVEEKGKPLGVSLCGRTRTEKQAEAGGDFKELGEGEGTHQVTDNSGRGGQEIAATRADVSDRGEGTVSSESRRGWRVPASARPCISTTAASVRPPCTGRRR